MTDVLENNKKNMSSWSSSTLNEQNDLKSTAKYSVSQTTIDSLMHQSETESPAISLLDEPLVPKKVEQPVKVAAGKADKETTDVV